MDSITTLGGKSKTTFLATEEYKITVELETAVALKKGQPIKLTADGKATVWAPADGRFQLLGYAYGDAAVGELTTIWSRAYAIIFAISDAAMDAGPVKYKEYDAVTDIEGTKGYSVYEEAATDPVANGWSIDQVDGADELIRVYLMD